MSDGDDHSLHGRRQLSCYLIIVRDLPVLKRLHVLQHDFFMRITYLFAGLFLQ